ncbi:DUF4030 domain-containing protein [Pseudalkalibacillus sp. R45]|uniref:DUF4030 domain-containing protein n=1 Tax=Pseudalkalibacillus sp. R45 TaxID=3457433 RepID=UPI003FCE51A6
MSNKFKHELEKIEIPNELHNRAKIGVEKAKAEMSSADGHNEQCKIKKSWHIRKITYICAAIVLFFGLFIGSAFVSPVMAKMASKLPYLGQLFESEPITSEIVEELEKMDYPIMGVGVSYQGKKEIWVRIEGSQDYVDGIKEEVENSVHDILGTRNYDAYTIKVSRYEPIKNKKITEVSERDKAAQEAISEISEELKQKDVKFMHHGYGYKSPDSKEIRFTISIPDSEKRVDLIEKTYDEILASRDIGLYTVEIERVDMMKKEQEGRWSEILHIIGEELLGKKEYKITGLAFSVYPTPEIIFKSSVKSTDPEAKEYGERMEKIIEKSFQSEEMQAKVKGDEYIITIRSKDKKKLN